VSFDSATLSSNANVQMITDGPCLSGTLEELEVGGAAKPMKREALLKVRTGALGLLEKVLASYEKGVATGEVGLDGTAMVENPAAGPTSAPTGLLYGRVQSGKTVAMITFCAAAIDNGFRVIVVLTSDFVKLVEQTADRFGALAGPLVKNALQSNSWDDDREHIIKHIGQHGIVFICTKNQQRLTQLVEFLKSIHADKYPALVLDDEADQATLDTTTQARSSGKKNAPTQASVIHRRTVQDDEGQSIRQTLSHHVFVQVTATPYALLLQNIDNPLRPAFTHLLEPGEGYTGGEAFFDVQHVEQGEPPLVSVDEDESSQIESSTGGYPPLGLQQALAFFLVAAGAQNELEPQSRTSPQNFLCHTSQKTADHAQVATLIRGYLNRISDDLTGTLATTETMMRITWAYDELRKTLPDAPALEAILERVRKRLPRREVPVVNSASSPVEFGRQLNFIIGGNILGRGLTIDNLLVTYYLRRAKVSQMDTVLQHARMFGYRKALMPFTRVFLPDSLGARFHFIHVAERTLRQQLAKGPGSGKVVVETMTQLRATRLNVLDTQNLAAYEGGDHIYPGAADLGKKAADRFREIEGLAREAAGGSLQESGFMPVSVRSLTELIPKLPFDSELANMWDPQQLCAVIDRTAARYDGKAYIFYRRMNRTKRTLPTGALSGPELEAARSKRGPVLCLFRDDGKKVAGQPVQEYWYPSLVFPADMATQLFNVTE
jgi:hypothetical protein